MTWSAGEMDQVNQSFYHLVVFPVIGDSIAKSLFSLYCISKRANDKK